MKPNNVRHKVSFIISAIKFFIKLLLISMKLNQSATYYFLFNLSQSLATAVSGSSPIPNTESP